MFREVIDMSRLSCFLTDSVRLSVCGHKNFESRFFHAPNAALLSVQPACVALKIPFSKQKIPPVQDRRAGTILQQGVNVKN